MWRVSSDNMIHVSSCDFAYARNKVALVLRSNISDAAENDSPVFNWCPSVRCSRCWLFTCLQSVKRVLLRFPFGVNGVEWSAERELADCVDCTEAMTMENRNRGSLSQAKEVFGFLQKMAGTIGTSNFLRAFLMVSLNSMSSGSMK